MKLKNTGSSKHPSLSLCPAKVVPMVVVVVVPVAVAVSMVGLCGVFMDNVDDSGTMILVVSGVGPRARCMWRRP